MPNSEGVLKYTDVPCENKADAVNHTIDYMERNNVNSITLHLIDSVDTVSYITINY